MTTQESMNEPRATVDLGYPTEPCGRIPAFHSVEEEAVFWDTHDFADFTEYSRQVPNPIDPALRKEKRVTVRLNPAIGNEVERKAKALGIGSSTLIRMWVLERLAEERKAS